MFKSQSEEWIPGLDITNRGLGREFPSSEKESYFHKNLKNGRKEWADLLKWWIKVQKALNCL